jgi:arylsulfatase
MKTKTLTKRNNRVLTAVLLPTSAALLAGCTDNSDNPVTDNNQSKSNGDGKYNIIFITTDQEA